MNFVTDTPPPRPALRDRWQDRTWNLDQRRNRLNSTLNRHGLTLRDLVFLITYLAYFSLLVYILTFSDWEPAMTGGFLSGVVVTIVGVITLNLITRTAVSVWHAHRRSSATNVNAQVTA